MIAASVPAAMYLTSLIVPVTDSFLIGSTDTYSGARAFEVGWQSMFDDKGFGWNFVRAGLVSAWWANPAIWAAVVGIALGWHRLAMVFAALGGVLTMAVLPHWGDALIELPGYWLWSGSATVALLMAMFLLPRRTIPFAQDYGPLAEPTEPPFAEPLTPDVP